MRLACIASTLTGLLALSASASPSAGSTCIDGATLIDVETGEARSGIQVVLNGDRIERLADAADPAACDHAIDARGKFMIPGLWDMHVHGTRRERTWPVYIANGVTGVRELFGQEDVHAFRRRLAAAQVKPRLDSAGPIVDGPPGIWPGSTVVADAEAARAAVRDQHEAGADFIKVYQLLSREAYFAIAEESKARGLPFAGHVPSSLNAKEASEAGQRAIEHLGDLPVACSERERELRENPPRSFLANRMQNVEAWRHASREKCDTLAGVLIRNGTWLVPTLSVKHEESRTGHPLPRDRERMAHFDAEALQWLAPAREADADEANVHRRALEVDMNITRWMHEAGVPILAGTDTFNPWTFPGFALHDELELLVRAGLSPLDALRAATLEAARYLDATDQYGRIAPGLSADLVLLDANPLEDIANTRRIHAVISEGVHHDRSALDALLATARRQAAESVAADGNTAP